MISNYSSSVSISFSSKYRLTFSGGRWKRHDCPVANIHPVLVFRSWCVGRVSVTRAVVFRWVLAAVAWFVPSLPDWAGLAVVGRPSRRTVSAVALRLCFRTSVVRENTGKQILDIYADNPRKAQFRMSERC